MKVLSENVKRRELKEERIAICPQFGCKIIKKVKPLKLGFLGFNKYPKCSKHKVPLVFIDEFIVTFVEAVTACLFDISSLPPNSLKAVVFENAPDEFNLFINNWIYCSPIGRGAQNVSRYLDGLSKGYIKLLSRKQKKVMDKEKFSKYSLLRTGLNIISEEYVKFLEELRKNADLCDKSKLTSISFNLQRNVKIWFEDQLKSIKNFKINEQNFQNEDLSLIKEIYDKILNANTCSLLLGNKMKAKISSFELFSSYYEFLQNNLCHKIYENEFQNFLNNSKNNIQTQSHDPPSSSSTLFKFIDLHQNHLKNQHRYITREYLCDICSKVAVNRDVIPKEL